jgi:hypothetical protein
MFDGIENVFLVLLMFFEYFAVSKNILEFYFKIASNVHSWYLSKPLFGWVDTVVSNTVPGIPVYWSNELRT